MNEQPTTATPPALPDRPTRTAHFYARLDRYKSLFARRWWIPFLCVGLGVMAAGTWIRYAPSRFVSVGRMIVNIKLSIPEGSVYTEELSNFLGTQAALMQSGVVFNRAMTRLSALKPEQTPSPVELKVSVSPKTTIFVMRATGEDPEYTRVFLQACMEEYIKLKREMRTQTSDTTLAGLMEQVLQLEKELRKADEESVAFQSTNSVVLLQEQGNSAGTHLALLNRQLSAMKSEHQLLQTLTLEQNLERQQKNAAALPGDDLLNSGTPPKFTTYSTDSEYFKAKQQIMLLKAQQQELGQYLRPKHPKMVTLSEEISQRERVLDLFRQQSLEQLESRKNSLAMQIQNMEKEVQQWETRTLDISKKTAEFQRIKSNSQRIQAVYDRLLATMQTLDVNKDITPESVTIMEKASMALPERPRLSRTMLIGALLGLGFSLVILMLLDRLDDRLNSVTELGELFDETVLGQIPREKPAGRKGELALIQPDDARHSFVEAYRNLRSSLLYMAESGKRPRTILVTSSIPNDGKSLTAANLAITLANAGSKVLLVDADLRKGILHSRFAVPSHPGVFEVLAERLDFAQAVRPTTIPNLSVLARGQTTLKSSELFLGPATDEFLNKAASRYDFVMLDTAPVMAADDVTSLAPHLDGVIFVVRAQHTSARVARAALDLLYQRKVRVLGLVFNAVRTSSGDYYYYYKYKDYYKPYPTA